MNMQFEIEKADIFHKHYAPLSEADQLAIMKIKQQAEQLHNLIFDSLSNAEEKSNAIDQRSIAAAKIASERLEESVMWAVKAICAINKKAEGV